MESVLHPQIHVSLKYLEEREIASQKYQDFLKTYYGSEQIEFRLNKIQWYSACLGYKILAAFIGNKIVGQSCAYKVDVILRGEKKELWWGIDSFVLPSYRGIGIGKKLQKRLHEDCPNFSSASYSKTNGIIKKKCGAKELFYYCKYYYPVSSFFTIHANSIINHFFSKSIIPCIRIPKLYYYINRTLNRQKYKSYTYKDIQIQDLDSEGLSLINESLSCYDFYVNRSIEYLNWKYTQNPCIRYHVIEVIRNKRQVGIIFFSDNYNGQWMHSKANLVLIFDVFFAKEELAAKKISILFVMNYFVKRKVKIDGILSLQKHQFYPYFHTKRFSVLSMLNIQGLIKEPYITYIDQDMDRMY